MVEPALVVRLGGLAAMVGGLLWSAKALIATTGGVLCAPLWPAKGTDYLFVLAQLLFLAGLVGLYARDKDNLEGSERGVAFALSSTGVIASCVGQLGLLSSEVVWYVFGLGCPVEYIGLMALGSAASQSQAKTLPYSWSSSLPFVIGLLGIFSLPLGVPPDGVIETCLTVTLRTLFGLGWVLVGYHLCFFSERGKEAYSGSQ